SLGLFGQGGGERSSTSPRLTSAASKARKTIESNAVFKSRMAKYLTGAISAGDLVRSLGRDVADKIPGCDLEDVLATALEATPDKRKRDLLFKASGGVAIGPGGSTRRLGASRTGGGDVTIEGRRGQQYLMSQGGERISSGKSSIFNGVEVGKEETPLKIKVTTRSNAALNAAEVANLETLRAKNGAGAFSRHFVGFTENIENYNGRGDMAMVMRAGSTDLRKVAEVNGGRLPQNKQRKYASQMASTVRCVHKAGLVWTDLKVDNMVLFERDEVKAIDLESAVPARSAPKSYTPATMPPDFAAASRGGFAGVTVDRSFDVWGLGMAVLHLYNGRSYFEGSSDPQTIAKIGQTGFSVDLSRVRDGRTKGLLEGLLDPDPQRRMKYFDSVSCRLALL
ncbi:unnamed protein product, partial [Hapterophycus canaliculatus]